MEFPSKNGLLYIALGSSDRLPNLKQTLVGSFI